MESYRGVLRGEVVRLLQKKVIGVFCAGKLSGFCDRKLLRYPHILSDSDMLRYPHILSDSDILRYPHILSDSDI